MVGEINVSVLKKKSTPCNLIRGTCDSLKMETGYFSERRIFDVITQNTIIESIILVFEHYYGRGNKFFCTQKRNSPGQIRCPASLLLEEYHEDKAAGA
jgi:hypothetical protein